MPLLQHDFLAEFAAQFPLRIELIEAVSEAGGELGNPDAGWLPIRCPALT